jgi:hypothetical protein
MAIRIIRKAFSKTVIYLVTVLVVHICWGLLRTVNFRDISIMVREDRSGW